RRRQVFQPGSARRTSHTSWKPLVRLAHRIEAGIACSMSDASTRIFSALKHNSRQADGLPMERSLRVAPLRRYCRGVSTTRLGVRLNERVTIEHVGQIVTATVADPVFAYDRVVIPAGAAVTGHIARFASPSRWARARTIVRGDFTPQRTPVVQFDMLTLPDGTQLPISTAVETGRERITWSMTTAAAKHSGVVARGKAQVAGQAKQAIAVAKQRVRDAVIAVKTPHKMQRLKEAAIAQLPYHPQYLRAGTLYAAELAASVSFGEIIAAEPALPGDEPSPQGVLTARLVTPLDSATTPKGTPIQAVLTEPVFSAEDRKSVV